MTRAEALRKLRDQADAIKALGATSLICSVRQHAMEPVRKATSISLSIMTPADGSMRWTWWQPSCLLEKSLRVEVDLTTRKGLHPLIRKRVEAEATRVF
jgi:uncharacterized protein